MAEVLFEIDDTKAERRMVPSSSDVSPGLVASVAAVHEYRQRALGGACNFNSAILTDGAGGHKPSCMMVFRFVVEDDGGAGAVQALASTFGGRWRCGDDPGALTVPLAIEIETWGHWFPWVAKLKADVMGKIENNSYLGRAHRVVCR